MVSETGDVQNFLAQHPPFNSLDEGQLEYATNNIYVAFSKSGSELSLDSIADDGPAIGLLMVRSGSLEIRASNGALIDRLSTGDYLLPALMRGDADNQQKVLVLEDCLYYELTEYAFNSLSSSANAIGALSDPERGRITSSDSLRDESTLSDAALLTQGETLTHSVEDIMTGDLVSADVGTTIREAAKLMKKHHISSLLIESESELVGIITDRDFRTRVLAEGVPDTTLISQVMTSKPMCIEVDGRLHDAQLKMMSEGVHHLPVLREGKLAGVITTSDILRTNNIEPLSLIRTISRANDINELSDAAALIPALIVRLIERDARAVEIGNIITTLSDGLTKRLLVLAEKQYGRPPCDYAWLAFGSQARQEQMLGSDQDNALLLPDSCDKADAAYFEAFCEYVNDGLDQCGMPYCPGDIMAKNPKWRLTLDGWKKQFANWIEEPSPKALMHSSIFFDMRHIAGDEVLTDALRHYVLKRARSNTIFQALMSDNALLHSPPLGFFKTFVLESDGDHNNRLNLKKRGTIPIVDIARNYSLAEGLVPVNTLDRLHALEKSGGLSSEMAVSLIDAHEFIAGIRLEAQARQFRDDDKVSNYLDPTELSPLVRHQLKDAFNIVRDAQAAMKARFGGGVL